MLSEVCHPGHVQDASQVLPGLFFFNWVDQWMMTRLNGFNLGGSSQLHAKVRHATHAAATDGGLVFDLHAKDGAHMFV